MLEILLLRGLAGKIGDIAEAKGRKRFGYQLLLVLLWFAGEIGGGIAGFMAASTVFDANEDTAWLYALGFALAGIGLACAVAFTLVNSLPPLQRDDELYRGADVHGMRSFDEYNRRHGRGDEAPPGRRFPDDEREGYQRDDAPRREADDRYRD